MDVATNLYVSAPRTQRGMTLHFPKEAVTKALWANIADLGWMKYVVEAPVAKAETADRTYREIAQSLPSSQFLDEMEGCIPPFTDEEIQGDPRLAAILK